MALGGNKQQSFATLLLKPNGQKNKMRTTEYLPIQQSPGIICPWEFADGAFRKPPLQTRSMRTHNKQTFVISGRVESIGEITGRITGQEREGKFRFRNFSWLDRRGKREKSRKWESLSASLSLFFARLSWLFPQLPLLHRLQCHRFTAGSESGVTAPEIKQSSPLGSSCFFNNFFQNLRESVAEVRFLGISRTDERRSEIKEEEDFAPFLRESAESAGKGGLDFLPGFGAWNGSFYFHEDSSGSSSGTTPMASSPSPSPGTTTPPPSTTSPTPASPPPVTLPNATPTAPPASPPAPSAAVPPPQPASPPPSSPTPPPATVSPPPVVASPPPAPALPPPSPPPTAVPPPPAPADPPKQSPLRPPPTTASPPPSQSNSPPPNPPDSSTAPPVAQAPPPRHRRPPRAPTTDPQAPPPSANPIKTPTSPSPAAGDPTLPTPTSFSPPVATPSAPGSGPPSAVTDPITPPTNGVENPVSNRPSSSSVQDNSPSPSGGGMSDGAKAGIGVIVAILVLSLVGAAFWYKKKRRKMTGYHAGFVMPSPSPSASPQVVLGHSEKTKTNYSVGSHDFKDTMSEYSMGNCRFFTYEEMHNITNGFSAQNLLGEGGFGSVYKGCLPEGREVAIKKLKDGSGQGEREFQAEVEIISRVHHRHLVSLVGYCISGDQRLLVYDFVPNDTLHYHLHGRGVPVLEWSARVKISAGSARGIAYLHEDCHPRIIHRDIKSSNILVDNNFEAQVADFGLARLAMDFATHVTTRVMGTFGYMAPEYASSGKLTEKSDVFSFGVVLLELITGRKPVDASNPLGDESLVEWARPLLTQALETGNVGGLLDPRLDKNFNEAEMFRMIEAAAACIRHSASRRPRMSQVVRALDSLADADLNNGIQPGKSEMFNAPNTAEIRLFQRMAFGSQDYTTDFTQSSSWNSSRQSTRDADASGPRHSQS